MEQEKRMAEDYEIIHALQIGAREVVVGINGEGEYLCGYCTENELFRSYTDNVLSRDYLEIMEIFTQRLNGQIDAVKAERKTIHIPLDTISASMCYPLDEADSLHGKIVAVKDSSLRYEYRRIDRQLMVVTGGSGASPNSRGTAVFGINLFNGRSSGRWRRSDILGEVQPEYIPEWAQIRLKMIEREKALGKELPKKERGEAR